MYNEVSCLAHRFWEFEALELNPQDFVREFRKGIYEEPEELPKFLNLYSGLVEGTIEGIDSKKRDKVTLAWIAGVCVLADYDSDGNLTSLSLEEGFDFLTPYYDDPKKYGFAMAALSVHLRGLEGRPLGEFVFGNYTIH